MTSTSACWLALLASTIVSTAAAQQPAPKLDINRGQQIAKEVCAACHGADGNATIAANPKIAGQPAEYLYKQLVDYTVKTGTQKAARENAIMAGFATQLSDDDKRNVAAWFASQRMKPGAARNKETVDAARRVYRAGIPEKSVPACSGCHNPTGAGIPIQYPRVSGQYAEYAEAQLKAFRDGTRRNSDAMQQISSRLSDAEIKALSDYMAGLR